MKNSDFGFIRVATATPKVLVGNVTHNVAEIISLAREINSDHVAIAVFPELCITGYTCGDLFFSTLLRKHAIEGLKKIRRASANFETTLIVGLPLAMSGGLFNVAAVVQHGKILGIIPKTFLAEGKEFYEERWFHSSRELTESWIDLGEGKIPMGTDILFPFKEMPEAVLAVEICQDLWAPIPPSTFHTLYGTTIIADLSASNELIGKSLYRQQLISQHSARLYAAYMYTSSGPGESSTDVVYAGHQMIAESGSMLGEALYDKDNQFMRKSHFMSRDIDIEHLVHDRLVDPSFKKAVLDIPRRTYRNAFLSLPVAHGKNGLIRHIEKNPFVAHDPETRERIAKEICAITVSGLAKRMEHTGITELFLGLSGGIDSTLALLIAVKTGNLLGLAREHIHTIAMPGFGTKAETAENAKKLAEAFGVSYEEIDIRPAIRQHFQDIGHDETKEDVTFENAQARERTQILFDRANQMHGLVMGTGDLSETAAGWCTFNGDHIAHYNVNGDIPKTLVKMLVQEIAHSLNDKKIDGLLRDISSAPYSPDLKTEPQSTDDLIGPSELRDFFLYHLVRWGSNPKKILFLANYAWRDEYAHDEIKKWLVVFLTRFFGAQHKRSVAVDGPKVGSIALSPRGDWRMPSDAEVSLWIEELTEEISFV